MNKKKAAILLCIGLGLVFIMGGCASGVKRVAVDETIDVSGKWNDTDSRLVSEEMISDVLSRPWLDRFVGKHGGKLPVVIVGTVRNRSHEHINTRTFVKNLERALINSGEVEFVAGKTERSELRDERKDQAKHSSEDTAKDEGEETGADFMLKGSINTISDKIEGTGVMYYQVNLELIAIQSHKKVWIGEKKIKKVIRKSRLGL